MEDLLAVESANVIPRAKEEEEEGTEEESNGFHDDDEMITTTTSYWKSRALRAEKALELTRVRDAIISLSVNST